LARLYSAVGKEYRRKLEEEGMEREGGGNWIGMGETGGKEKKKKEKQKKRKEKRSDVVSGRVEVEHMKSACTHALAAHCAQ